ncbi:MAG: UDP-3-O-(3-hydroxymyristoyl)glucosamine N-acyltransferase [Pyrinomonadaceae bacterium]
MKAKDIARLVGAELRGDGEVEITSAADIARAKAGDLAFYDEARELPPTAASCVVVSQKFPAESATSITLLIAHDPKLAFAVAAGAVMPAKAMSGRNPSAFISEKADVEARFIGAFVCIGENSRVSKDAEIHEGVRIGANVEIGRSTIIFPNCVIYDGVAIGENCVIHAGAVIGADGFGFVRDSANGYVKFPQIGKVVIEDNVEIGANTCIDRGSLGETRVGEGTKIDNLVQIAHNVEIGKRVVIAAQTGISGSTVIEDDCVIGGQVGMGDHAHVQSGAIIGSQAGILPGKIVRPGVWWGTPIQPLDEYKRQNAYVKGLERLNKKVKELQAELAKIKDR